MSDTLIKSSRREPFAVENVNVLLTVYEHSSSTARTSFRLP